MFAEPALEPLQVLPSRPADPRKGTQRCVVADALDERRRGVDPELHGADLASMQVVGWCVRESHRDVGLAARQRDRVGRERDRQLDARVAVHERRERGLEAVEQGVEGRDPELAPQLRISSEHPALNRENFVLHALGDRHDIVARRGCHQSIGRAIEQPNPQLVLERPESSTDGGMRDAEGRGGSEQRATAGNSQDVRHVVPVHAVHCCTVMYWICASTERRRTHILRA